MIDPGRFELSYRSGGSRGLPKRVMEMEWLEVEGQDMISGRTQLPYKEVRIGRHMGGYVT